jgi:hypothetical protein
MIAGYRSDLDLGPAFGSAMAFLQGREYPRMFPIDKRPHGNANSSFGKNGMQSSWAARYGFRGAGLQGDRS